MTNFSIDAETHWDRVQGYLVKTRPDCEVKSEPVVSGQAPMLFMWMAHLMAGFAFSNGDTRTSYRELFGSFKDYYAENRERLDAVDLSFVFCVQPDLPDLEQFSSEIETDVYFCRKFVVPLTGSLDRSFEGLPFLPLALGTGRLQRPPSAQTYMHQCGVSATLAKYLAVPHQRGAENIVKDCLDESSNWTPILASQGRTKMSVGGGQSEEEAVRLDSVAIENFRAYRKRQIFHLGSAVTVLYGPNGFGKTSFFDAMDFVATGGVGRLGLSASTDRFAKAVAHLDSKPEDAVVGLRFSAGGAVRELSRHVGSRAQARVDGAGCGRKQALVEITGGGSELTDRIEHLVSLFRATHLFSQGHPELAKGFDRDCALPPEVVSHMLAFDDYANARRKAAEVCDVLGRALAEATGNMGVLRRQIEEAEVAIGSVERKTTEYGGSASAGEAVAALRRRVGEAGLDVPAEEAEGVFVRGCRAAIRGRLAEGEGRVARLTALVEEARMLPSVGEGLAELMKRRRRAERELGTAAAALEEAEGAEAAARETVREWGDLRTRGRARAEAVRWARELQPRYRDLLGLEGKMKRAVRDAMVNVERLRERRLAARRELRAREQAAGNAASRLEGSRRLAAELEELVAGAATWRSDLAAVGDEGARQQRLGRRLEELRGEEEKLSARQLENEAAQVGLRERIEVVERERSELAGLLGRLEDYIGDGLCPLCGHDHGSIDVLRAQVGKRRALDEVSGPRRRLRELRDGGAELERGLARVREDWAAQHREAEELREERRMRDARIASFENATAKIDITVGEPAATEGEVRERWAKVRDGVVEMEHIDLASQIEVDEARGRVAELERAIEAGEKSIVDAERELEDCRSESERLRHDRRAEGVSLDAEAATLVAEGVQQMEELEKAEAAVSEAVSAAKERAVTVNGLRQRVAALAAARERLTREIGTRRKTVTATNARLAEFGLGEEAEEREVVRLLEEETKANSRLAELLDFADGVEVAVDTATTAAALQQQRQAIRRRERRIEETKADTERYKSWQRYFSDLGERLSGRQKAAIASFAEEYGPTATAIQERLRSVYGFDGIDTRSHEATIRVRVKRGKETLRPTDYFSDSQQRTLLLGLFLTACVSQTWSSLSTVLLDDPVMHFDDLNTYAFLDMVAGFVDGHFGPRQFIISTCDRKVLQLARKRFSHLEDQEARFYELSAIGREGPIVNEMAAV